MKTKNYPGNQAQAVAHADMTKRVDQLSRSSRWLLVYMLSKHPDPIGIVAALPVAHYQDQPKMTQLNGLVRRMWVRQVGNGIYGLTPNGRFAAELAKAKGGAL